MAARPRTARAVKPPPKGNAQNEKVQWATDVLGKLGIAPLQSSVQKLVAWANQEGGNWNNSARYNPLNTTLSKPGAGNTGAQGNIKVYTSWAQGIEATVDTLKLPAYRGIIAQLESGGNPAAFEAAVNASPWGTKFPAGAVSHASASSTGAGAVLGGGTPAEKAKGVGEAATGWVKELLPTVVIPGILLLAGAFLAIYGIMIAIRPRENAFSLPIPKAVPLPV